MQHIKSRDFSLAATVHFFLAIRGGRPIADFPISGLKISRAPADTGIRESAGGRSVVE
jgi:hypothetical protein